MSTIGQRLDQAMKNLGINDYELSERSGVPQPTIFRIRTAVHGDPRGSTIKKLAKGLGITEIELRGMENLKESAPTNYINTEPAPELHTIPMLNWVQAGNWAEIIELDEPIETITTAAKITQYTYALRVRGDSMTNPHGSPSLPDGCIVIIDGNRNPKNGDIVIARLDDSIEATIKRLVIDGNQKFLKPLNPQYPAIPINGNCTICGVAIRVEFDL